MHIGMHLAPPRAKSGLCIDILDHHDGRAGAGFDIAVIGEAGGCLILIAVTWRVGRADSRRPGIADHRFKLGKGAMEMAHGKAPRASLGRKNFQRIADCRCVDLAQLR